MKTVVTTATVPCCNIRICLVMVRVGMWIVHIHSDLLSFLIQIYEIISSYLSSETFHWDMFVFAQFSLCVCVCVCSEVL